MPETSQRQRALAALAVFFDAESKSMSNDLLDGNSAVALLDIITCTHSDADGTNMNDWEGVRWLREYIEEEPGLYIPTPAISERVVLDQHISEGHAERVEGWCTQGLCNWENALTTNE